MHSKTVWVVNGPNLNLLGQREPEIYGTHTLEDVEALCQKECLQYGIELIFAQSNHEGQLVDWVHEASSAQKTGACLGMVLNAGAYTHTSIALHDAIKAAQLRVVELHISNIHAREPFRHHSYISSVAQGIIMGFGVQSYALAIQALTKAP